MTEIAMQHFWWLVTVRAFNFSLGFIGSVSGAIPFTVLFLLVGALLVLRYRGLAEFKEHLVRNVLWFLLSVTAAWLPFFIWGMVHEPYLMQKEAASAFRAEIEKEIPAWKRPASMSEGPLGPIAAVEFVDMFRSLLQPCILKITYPSVTNEFGATFKWILTQREGAGCHSFQERDPADNAPPASEVSPNTESGIVLHSKQGFKPGEELAWRLYNSGLRLVVSHEMPTPSPNNLVWIDIGPGSPWK